MARWLRIALLLTVSASSFAQPPAPSKAAALPGDPSVFIRKLYRDVIRYSPLGILDYEFAGHPKRHFIEAHSARRRFMPYLSKALRQRVALHDACLVDWYRQYPESDLKPPIFEGGIFSGGNEEGEPERAMLEAIKSQTDGSLYAFVRLSGRPDPPEWFIWHVKVVLVREGKGVRVDDVIYLHSDEPGEGFRLSKLLSDGCDGTHWVGP